MTSFAKMTKYLLTLESNNILYVLSEHLTQDPLKNYFGKQRSKGGRNKNPSVSDCLHNASSLRIKGSIAQGPVRGNSSRKRLLFPTQIVDDTPLPKRRRKSGK